MYFLLLSIEINGVSFLFIFHKMWFYFMQRMIVKLWMFSSVYKPKFCFSGLVLKVFFFLSLKRQGWGGGKRSGEMAGS